MLKRLLPLLLGLAILAAVPLGANAAGSVSINLNFNSASPAAPKSDLYLNLVFASAGQYFGFTAFQSCAGYYQRPSELVAALYISSETGRPPRTILQAKHGKGWGRLAKEMGVHPGYWAKGKGPKKHRYVEYWDDEEFETRLYLRYLGEYYGTDQGQLTVWLHRGLSQGDLILGLNLAARAHKPVAAIWDLRIRGLSWTAIAVRYHQSPSALSRAVPPSRHWQSRGDWGDEGKDWD